MPLLVILWFTVIGVGLGCGSDNEIDWSTTGGETTSPDYEGGETPFPGTESSSWGDEEEGGADEEGGTEEEGGDGEEGDENPGDEGDGPISLNLNDCSSDNQALIEEETIAILDVYCAGCHKPGGAGKAKFEDVLDLAEIIGVGDVKVGSPEDSVLIEKLFEEDDPMPPTGFPSPTDEEIAVLEAWIVCLDESNNGEDGDEDGDENGDNNDEEGDEDGDEGGDNPGLQEGDFVSLSTVLAWMRDDLDSIQLNERKFIRYITFEHIFNAGATFEEVEVYRHGISKLVNSLSWDATITPPTLVDSYGLVVRIDIRDYAWDDLPVPLEEVDGTNVWDQVEEQYPYPLRYEDSEDAEFLVDFTESEIPFIQGDWFASKAAQPPLYHIILGLPDTRSKLEELLGVNVQANIDLDKAKRAGFSFSNVSANNRVVERHQMGINGNTALIGNYTGAYWLSYDFADNQGIKNIFQHPVDFEEDGNEIIFNLPNGFQAYYINDEFGDRIDSAPTAIVSDDFADQPDIVTGLSCMGCHYSGMKNAEDKIRYYVENYDNNYTADVIGKVNKLYPKKSIFDALMEEDDNRFDDALADAWVPKATERSEEQIETLANTFDEKMSLSRVSASVGLSVDEFSNHKDIGRLKLARAEIADLVDNNAFIKRDIFEESFRDVVCFLDVAEPVNIETGDAGCSIARVCNLNGDIPGDVTLTIGEVELSAVAGSCSPCRAVPVGDSVDSSVVVGENENQFNENGQIVSVFNAKVDKNEALEFDNDSEKLITLSPVFSNGELVDVEVTVENIDSPLTCQDVP